MIRVKPFSPELTTSILNTIDTLLKATPGPHYAAFDADGTLWDGDVGENFFQYQIDHCQLPALKGLDPWEHYLSLKKKHPPTAYLWLAQICADYPIAEVREWSKLAVEKFPLPVFESQKKLIQELLQRQIHVSVVSASVQWAVEGAVSHVGLPAEAALGVKTQVVGGVVTRDGDGPITWREGKPLALLARTQGRQPILCAGNSSGDIHLLECSQGVRLALQTQLPITAHPKLYEDEQQLLAIARQKGWLIHSFK